MLMAYSLWYLTSTERRLQRQGDAVLSRAYYALGIIKQKRERERDGGREGHSEREREGERGKKGGREREERERNNSHTSLL